MFTEEELERIQQVSDLDTVFDQDLCWEAVGMLTGLKPDDFKPRNFVKKYKLASDEIFEWPMLRAHINGKRANQELFDLLVKRKKERSMPLAGYGNYPEHSGHDEAEVVGKNVANVVLDGLVGYEKTVGVGLWVLNADDEPLSMWNKEEPSKLAHSNWGVMWLFNSLFFQNDRVQKNAYGAWELINDPNHYSQKLEKPYCFANFSKGPDKIGTIMWGTSDDRKKARENLDGIYHENKGYDFYGFKDKNNERSTIDLPLINKLLSDKHYLFGLIARWQEIIDDIEEEKTKEKSDIAKFFSSGGEKMLENRKNGAYFLNQDALLKELFQENYKWLFSLDGFFTLSKLNRALREKFLVQLPGFALPEGLLKDFEELEESDLFDLIAMKPLYEDMKKLDKFFQGSSPCKKTVMKSVSDGISNAFSKLTSGVKDGLRGLFQGPTDQEKKAFAKINGKKIEDELAPESYAYCYELNNDPNYFEFPEPEVANMPPGRLHAYTGKPLIHTNKYFCHDDTNITYTNNIYITKPTGYSKTKGETNLNSPNILKKNNLPHEKGDRITHPAGQLYENDCKKYYKVYTEKFDKNNFYYEKYPKKINAETYRIIRKEVKKTEFQQELRNNPKYKAPTDPDYDPKNPQPRQIMKRVPKQVFSHYTYTCEPGNTEQINSYTLDGIQGPRFSKYLVRENFPKTIPRKEKLDVASGMYLPVFTPKGKSWAWFTKHFTLNKLVKAFIALQDREKKVKKLYDHKLNENLEIAHVQKRLAMKMQERENQDYVLQEREFDLKKEELEHAVNFLIHSGLLYRLALAVAAVVTLFFFVKNLFPHLFARLYKEPLPTIITDHNLPNDSWFGFLLNLVGAKKEPEREKFIRRTYYPKKVNKELKKLFATWGAILKNEIRTGKKGVYSNTILYGPPGTGKSLCAKIAAEVLNKIPGAEVCYVIVPCSAFSQGDRATAMKSFVTLINLFIRQSKKLGRLLIIVFDESPACFPPRGGKRSSDLTDLMTAYFLSMFPNASQEGIIFLATTNFPRSLDQAFASRMHSRASMLIDLTRRRSSV